MNHPISTGQQLGQLLHGVRKAKAMTQARLALQLGLTRTRLSRGAAQCTECAGPGPEYSECRLAWESARQKSRYDDLSRK